MTLDDLSPREHNLAPCFFDPAIALRQASHTVCPYDEKVVQLLSNLSGKQLGIWGAFPPYAEDGSISLLTDPLDPACFRLWRLKENQPALLEYVRLGKSTSQFSMVMSADVDDSILKRMAGQATENLSTYDFYVKKAVVWVEILGWAYFGMWDDNDLAIAMFASSTRFLQREFEERLE